MAGVVWGVAVLAIRRRVAAVEGQSRLEQEPQSSSDWKGKGRRRTLEWKRRGGLPFVWAGAECKESALSEQAGKWLGRARAAAAVRVRTSGRSAGCRVGGRLEPRRDR